jgi:hypothetical protein
MNEELRVESSSAEASYAWLANKIGAGYRELNKDLNIVEETRKQIENVKKLVEKKIWPGIL